MVDKLRLRLEAARARTAEETEEIICRGMETELLENQKRAVN